MDKNEELKPHMNIPLDEIEVLKLTARLYGRSAKSMLRDAWRTGSYRMFSSSIDISALQRFRNSGASRINKIVLSRL